MSTDADLHMAMLLQQQFDSEFNVEHPGQDLTYSNPKKKKHVIKKSPSKSSKCLTDPSWELVDPTPNIHILFVQFSQRFFWDKLLTVTVAFSKRMTSCAGICSYQGRGGMCSITLSEPLLKLRPRKDLIETLLHEMIHAFLFVTHNNRDRDGHGPEFHKHMHRINEEAGTNITVFHNFHDEVKLYQQHWWRCEGPCQKRPPFFGMVRRAINRAPGPNDRWWAEHVRNCGGTFIKVKEPEKKTITAAKKSAVPSKGSQKNNKENSSTNLPDIRNFIPGVHSSTNKPTNTTNNTNIHTIQSVKGRGGNLGVKNANGTVVINSKSTKSSFKDSDVGVSPVIPSGSNIVGFTNNSKTKPNIEVFAGTGKKLSNNSKQPKNISDVKNHWANKFPSPPSSSTASKNEIATKRKSPNSDSTSAKKQKFPDSNNMPCPNCNKLIQRGKLISHLDFCLNKDQNITNEFSDDSITFVKCPVCSDNVDEKLLNEHLDDCLNCTNEKASKSNTVPKPIIKITKPKENVNTIKKAISVDNHTIITENTNKNKRSKTPETVDFATLQETENKNKSKRKSKTPQKNVEISDNTQSNVILCNTNNSKSPNSKKVEQLTDNILTTIRCFTSSGKPQIRSISLDNVKETSESNNSLICSLNPDTKKGRRKSESDKNIESNQKTTTAKERRKSVEKLSSSKKNKNDESSPSSSSIKCYQKCAEEKIRCEVCEKYIALEKHAAHLEKCLTKYYENIEKDLDIPRTTVDSNHVMCLVCNEKIEKSSLNLHLEDCVGTAFNEEQSEDMDTEENESEEEDNEQTEKNVEYNCPICMLPVEEEIMNRHIDECLNAAALENDNFLD